MTYQEMKALFWLFVDMISASVGSSMLVYTVSMWLLVRIPILLPAKEISLVLAGGCGLAAMLAIYTNRDNEYGKPGDRE